MPGRAYLAGARELLDPFDQLGSSVNDAGGPRGLLRLSVPVSFGAVEIGPALLDFAAAHAAVGLEVFFLRSCGQAGGGGVRCRRADRRTYGEFDPGCPAAFDEPYRHLRRAGLSRPPWRPARAGGPRRAPNVDHRLNPADPFVFSFGPRRRPPDGARRRAVALRGCPRPASRPPAPASASREPRRLARSTTLRAGRLRPLLCEFEPDPVPIHAVYPQTRHLAAKVRAFVDFLGRPLCR